MNSYKLSKLKFNISFSKIQVLVFSFLILIVTLSISTNNSSDLTLINDEFVSITFVFLIMIISSIWNTTKIYTNNKSEQWNDYINGITNNKQSDFSNIMASIALSLVDIIVFLFVFLISWNFVSFDNDLSLFNPTEDPGKYRSVSESISLHRFINQSFPFLIIIGIFITIFIVFLMGFLYKIFRKNILALFIIAIIFVVGTVVFTFLKTTTIPFLYVRIFSLLSPTTMAQYLFVLFANDNDILCKFARFHNDGIFSISTTLIIIYSVLVFVTPVIISIFLFEWKKLIPSQKEKITSEIIEFKKISFSYSEHPILQDVKLKLEPGKIYGLIGRNGAGKSTLMRMIMGFLTPSKGQIENTYNNVIYVPAELKFPEYSTQKKLVKNILKGMSKSNEEYLSFNEKYYDTLDISAISPGIKMKNCSSGMQKKIELSIAFASNKYDVYMFDEPTILIDIPTKKEYFSLIKELRNDKKIIIISSHEVMELEKHVDEFIVINNKLVTVMKNTPKTRKDIEDLW